MNSNSLVTIRQARLDDAEDIATVQLAAWLAAYPNENLGITADRLRRHLQGAHGERVAERLGRIRGQIKAASTVDRPTANYFVAVLQDAVIGVTSPCISDDGRRRVGALYVLPEMEGKGIGHRLLERNLAWHGKYHDVYLNVVAYNAHAVAFYRHHGFVLTGRREQHAIGVPSIAMPEVEMLRSSRGAR